MEEENNSDSSSISSELSPISIESIVDISIASNKIWCTLVMISDDYIPGAIVMAQSLRNVKTIYPIYCMVDDQVSASGVRLLYRHFDCVIKVPIIERSSLQSHSSLLKHRYGKWINKSFTKWNIFNPGTFKPILVDKVMFVDADMLFLENCDYLLESLVPPAATFVTPWVQPYANHGYNPYGSLAHGAIIQQNTLKEGLAHAFVGSASLVLIRPTMKLWCEFEKILKSMTIYGHPGCKVGVDEQILAEVMTNCGAVFRNIHQQYNWTVGYTNLFLHGEKAKVYHYHSAKPWHLGKYLQGRVNVTTKDEETEKNRMLSLHNAKYFDPWLKIASQIGEREPEFRSYFI